MRAATHHKSRREACAELPKYSRSGWCSRSDSQRHASDAEGARSPGGPYTPGTTSASAPEPASGDAAAEACERWPAACSSSQHGTRATLLSFTPCAMPRPSSRVGLRCSISSTTLRAPAATAPAMEAEVAGSAAAASGWRVSSSSSRCRPSSPPAAAPSSSPPAGSSPLSGASVTRAADIMGTKLAAMLNGFTVRRTNCSALSVSRAPPGARRGSGACDEGTRGQGGGAAAGSALRTRVNVR